MPEAGHFATPRAFLRNKQSGVSKRDATGKDYRRTRALAIVLERNHHQAPRLVLRARGACHSPQRERIPAIQQAGAQRSTLRGVHHTKRHRQGESGTASTRLQQCNIEKGNAQRHTLQIAIP